jgi:hypothetical protein
MSQKSAEGKVGHAVEHAKGILRRIGFNKENLKEEVYWPAKAAGEEEGHQ